MLSDYIDFVSSQKDEILYRFTSAIPTNMDKLYLDFGGRGDRKPISLSERKKRNKRTNKQVNNEKEIKNNYE